MIKYKVNSPEDIENFVVTQTYLKIYHLFKGLKTQKGRIIHVIGAPGTGKSINIYEAMINLDLDIYEAKLNMDDINKSSGQVYREFYKILKYELNANNDEDVYGKASRFDAVLFADRFHDSHLLYENKVGFSVWMDQAGFKSIPFYVRIIIQYIKHIKDFRNINLIFQTAWTFRFKGVKYDLFTDLGVFSRLLVGFLKIFFDVVEVTYKDSEIIQIVKKRFPDVDMGQIKRNRAKFGNKIRFILEALKED
jgi:hypothetical protein